MQPNTQSRHYIQYHWNQIALMYMWTFVNLCTCENFQLWAWRNRGNNLAPHSLTYLLLLLCWEWAEENFTPAFRSLRSSSSWVCVYVCVQVKVSQKISQKVFDCHWWLLFLLHHNLSCTLSLHNGFIAVSCSAPLHRWSPSFCFYTFSELTCLVSFM